MIDEIINRWKIANPLSSHGLGFHEFDGQLPNKSKEFIDNRITEIKEDLNQLEKIKKDKKSKFEKFEIELIIASLNTELFEYEEKKDYVYSPESWMFPLAMPEVSYSVRNFAPIDKRIKSIIAIEKQIPTYLEQAKFWLDKSLAKSKLLIAIAMLSGIISYYKDRLISFITKTDNEELIDEWSEVNLKAIETMESFFNDLKSIYLPNSHENFKLGKQKFLKYLKFTEGIDIDINKLLKVGEEDLERNYKMITKIVNDHYNGDMTKLMDDVNNDVPQPENLLEEARGSLKRTRKFLEDSKLVGLPTDDECDVIDTPEVGRSFIFAAMSTPGPFEVPEASEAFYWVTPPDPNWPETKIKQFMGFFNRPSLENVTVHEVYPGHFVQLLYNKQSKSDISKIFADSISMIEGWAHYAEEMIYEAGYEPMERYRFHIGQLFLALIRNVRYVSAIKMHCFDMTVEESKKLFMEKGFLPEPNAEMEANRGTIDPMYLNYTLGKLLIKKLREDYKKEKGDKFTLRKFHDEILSYGSPPITALRNVMLDSPGNMDNLL